MQSRAARPHDAPDLTLIERMRRYYGMTLRQLEERTAIPLSVLGRIMNGQTPDVLQAIAIARAFEVRVEDLWGDVSIPLQGKNRR